MTDIRNEMVGCPKCKASGEAAIYSSVNVTLDPGLKERLINMDLFKFRCPNCENITVLRYGFLYHDMDKRLWIELTSADDSDPEFKMKMKMASAMARKNGYRILVVDNYFLLRDIVLIHEDGLDDLAIVTIKFMKLGQMMKEKNVLYDGGFRDESGNTSLLFRYSNDEKDTIGINVPMDVYSDFVSASRKYLSDKSWVRVDASMASALLDILNSGMDGLDPDN